MPATLSRARRAVIVAGTEPSLGGHGTGWSRRPGSETIAAMAASTAIRSARGPGLPVAAAAVALLAGAVAENAALGGTVWGPWLVALDAAVGTATVLAGLLAWTARPDSRAGPALVAIGGLWYLGAFGYGTDMRLVDFVGFPLQGWHDVLLVVLLLAITPGGLRERPAQVIAAGALASHALLALARLLLRPPIDLTSCFCIGNRITGITDPGAYETVVRIASVAEAGCALAALVLVGQRWRRASAPARHTLAPLLGAAVATTALVTYNRVATRVVTAPVQPSDAMLVLMAAVRIAIPVAIVFSLVRGRRARTRVADVVIGLDDRGLAGGSEEMRRALADPSLRLLRAGDDGFAEAVSRAGPGATLLERDGVVLGALVHDPALREEPELLDAVAAAARLALHNERLAAEVRAQLDEVQASRQRIVAAGEAERRRLERDLHDGAQQRLVALALRLRGIERRAGHGGDVVLADAVGAAAEELDGALADIRELARGIRPPVLQEQGLGPALEALAARTPLPVAVDLRLSGRLPDVVEATAYFAASEALANVLKHAEATRVDLAARGGSAELVLRIADDGRGGADGLIALRDRLEALGGSLAVESPAGGGTTLTARIPQG
jgi:signal transduction histidine kinase